MRPGHPRRAFASVGVPDPGASLVRVQAVFLDHGGGPRASSRLRRCRQQDWTTVPDPSVTDPTDVIIRIETATICGTDLHILKGEVSSFLTHRFPLSDIMQAYEVFADPGQSGALKVLLTAT